jgi:hypothetical protein
MGRRTVKRICLLLPLLFAAGLVLAPFAENSQELLWMDLARPLGIALAGAAVVTAVVRCLVADVAKAAVVAALLVLFAAGYGTAADVGRLCTGGDVAFPTSWQFLAAWVALVGTAVVATLRGRGQRTEFARLAFVLGGLILAEPLLILSLPSRHRGGDAWHEPGTPRANSTGARAERGPDVYFIVLDGYGRSDVLRDKYGCDIEPFLAAMKERGFCVIGGSAANYAQTHLSLAATLNMTYLDGVANAIGRDSSSRIPLLAMIAGNRAASAFRQAGYRYLTLSTGYLDTALADADVAYAGAPALSHFAMALLGRTPLAAWPALQYDFHRRRLGQVFDRLAAVAAEPGPTFVVAHFTVPHHPFIYGRDGRPVTPARPFTFADDVGYFQASAETRAEYRRAYAEQIGYVNARISRVIDAILARSRRTPVIVVQGDHGPSVDWNDPAKVDIAERMPMLSVCLLPGIDGGRLPQTMSPVNTMRMLVDAYAGVRLPPLPDRSYYSTWARPYTFTDVTELVRSR